jgi:hypothetical protein
MSPLDDISDAGENQMSSPSDILDLQAKRMPRPIRHDLKPEIWLDDNSEDETAAQKYVRKGRRVRVYNDDKKRLAYISKFLHLDPEFLDDLRHELGPDSKYFDGNLVLKLLTFVSRSKIEPVRDKDHQIVVRDGKQRWRLEVLGCRALFGTQEHLASLLERHRDHVVQQIKLLRRALIITNSGRGFIDFNADLVWKGSHDHQLAFVNEHHQPGYIKLY